MKTVLCFGDSNTHGTMPMQVLGEFKRYPPNVRWPGVFARQLDKGWKIIEEGHPGRTTLHDDPIDGVHKNGFPALLAALETHRPTDVVILMLGTNDLKQRYSVTARDIAASIEKLVVTIRTSPAGPDGTASRLMVVAPPPILETGVLSEIFEDGARKSADLAKYYKDVALRHDCAFLDSGSVIKSSTTDGIHFEEADHKVLGLAIARQFRLSFVRP